MCGATCDKEKKRAHEELNPNVAPHIVSAGEMSETFLRREKKRAHEELNPKFHVHTVSKKKRVLAPPRPSWLSLGSDTADLTEAISQYRRELESSLAPSSDYLSVRQPELSFRE
jgi:hypothetical protein